MNKKCACDVCNCDIDFSNDNGYGYVLDELKATRDHIDDIIRVIEKRVEKDAIIDEVLNTDYNDEVDEQEICDIKDNIDLDTLAGAIALSKVLSSNQKKKHSYPWWSIYPNMWSY